MAKRILIPLDRSAAAESIVPTVMAAARSEGATVRLLHVEPVPENCVNEEGRIIAYADQEMARLEGEALDYLRVVALPFQGVPTECAVRFGDPVTEILREADAFEAEMIAVATAGRSALGRVLLGSVAEHIVRKAKAPVLLMRPASANG